MGTNKRTIAFACAAILAAVAGCSAIQQSGGEAEAREKAVALMQKDFKSRGQATVDRLKQDEVQSACTKYAHGAAIPADEAKKIEASQLSLVKYPADGKLLGDWKSGEKIAQAGVGKQWSDDPKAPGGGNCYACHQLSPQELSFGTIGPSLRGYGKVRGNSLEMQKYTYAKIYNSEAFNACSSMPRFGSQGILTEQQIKDVVALLMDPNSPVNK